MHTTPFPERLRSALVDFVADTLRDKPADVRGYMTQWAAGRIHSADAADVAAPQEEDVTMGSAAAMAAGSLNLSAAPAVHNTRSMSDQSITVDADSTAASDNDEVAPSGSKAEGGDGSPMKTVTVTESSVRRVSISSSSFTEEKFAALAAELRDLADRRVRLYRDLSKGCRDRYMMALEDSENDLMYLGMLEGEMLAAKMVVADIAGERTAFEDELLAIVDRHDGGELRDFYTHHKPTIVDDMHHPKSFEKVIKKK